MKKLIANAQQPTQETIVKILNEEGLSKSKKMIALFDLGLATKEIAELLTEHFGKVVRYNFVYNVLSNYCAVNGIAIEQAVRASRKEAIIELFMLGKSNKEIGIELKTNFTYVFNTIKMFKAEHPDLAAKAGKMEGPVADASGE
jgi:hypothetical protein